MGAAQKSAPPRSPPHGDAQGRAAARGGAATAASGGDAWVRSTDVGSHLRFAAAAAALAALTTSNAITNPYVLDDVSKVRNNPDIRSLRGLAAKLVYPYDGARRLNRNDPSRPLTYLSYALNYCLLGPEPWHFRLANVVAHVACSWSLRALLRALLVPATCPHERGPRVDAAHEQHEDEGGGAGHGAGGGVLADVTSVLYLTSPLAVGTATYVYARSEVWTCCQHACVACQPACVCTPPHNPRPPSRTPPATPGAVLSAAECSANLPSARGRRGPAGRSRSSKRGRTSRTQRHSRRAAGCEGLW